MRVGVIGAQGFIGGAALSALRDTGWSVVALVEQAANTFPPDVECRLVRRTAAAGELARSLRGMDAVVIAIGHAIPAAFQTDALARFGAEVRGLAQWAGAIAEARVSRCIYISSGGTVYGTGTDHAARETAPPAAINTYGAAKLACESVVRSFATCGAFSATVLRVANAYGPGQRPGRGQGVVATFIDAMLRNQTIEVWGDGNDIRDFIHVHDVASAIVSALRYDRAQTSIFNIGSGVATTVSQLLALLHQALPSTPPARHVPRPSGSAYSSVLDISRAAQILAWQPVVQLPAGLRGTIDWHRHLAASVPSQL
ncbi:MAG TPA: NAD-dependent epimerase/dehydratase family protein [Casimicrobium huifangae]|nr:NAD-dependent epimerase/dehydratase family protein [Casimicrobium huifangae]